MKIAVVDFFPIGIKFPTTTAPHKLKQCPKTMFEEVKYFL